MARETKQERLERITLYTRSLWERNLLVGGVDEVGRGPLAGPVVTACAIMPPEPLLADINDSKKIAEKKREALFDLVRDTAIRFAIVEGSVEEIEAINIREATRKAMATAAMQANPDWVLVDAEKNLAIPMPQEGLIHGDAEHYPIAAASILAKVYRDRLMQRYDEEYPGYGFAQHKGYGTAAHIEAIKKLGPCPIHRMSFLKGILK